MQRQGLDPITVSALLSVLDLVSWEIICKCVKDMALHMAQVALCEYETLLQGFNAILVFQGTLAIPKPARFACLYRAANHSSASLPQGPLAPWLACRVLTCTVPFDLHSATKTQNFSADLSALLEFTTPTLQLML